MSLQSIRKPVLGQCSTLKKHVTFMGSKPEPVIWSCDTGIPFFDRCKLTITWMSNIKDEHCKPRLHDLVFMAAMSCNIVIIERVHPWSMLLAMFTMKIELHGFLFYVRMWLYSYRSSAKIMSNWPKKIKEGYILAYSQLTFFIYITV